MQLLILNIINHVKDEEKNQKNVEYRYTYEDLQCSKACLRHTKILYSHYQKICSVNETVWEE